MLVASDDASPDPKARMEWQKDFGSPLLTHGRRFA